MSSTIPIKKRQRISKKVNPLTIQVDPQILNLPIQYLLTILDKECQQIIKKKFSSKQ